MWTLYDATTYLKIECYRKPEPGPDQKPGAGDKPGWNDTADVLIRSVELVRSEEPSFAVPAPAATPNWSRSPAASSRWAARRPPRPMSFPPTR